MQAALRVATLAWVVAGVVWLVKVVLIAENGGSDTSGGLVGVAFFIGVVALVVAGAACGFVLLRRRRSWLGYVGLVLGVVVTLVGFVVLEGVLKAIVPANGWFEGEVGIVGTAIVALTLGVTLSRRRPTVLPTSAEQPT